MKEKIETLRAMTAVQCSNGYWDYDPYMHGMANGLLLALHIIEGKQGDPEYLTAPAKWGFEKLKELKDSGSIAEEKGL